MPPPPDEPRKRKREETPDSPFKKHKVGFSSQPMDVDPKLDGRKRPWHDDDSDGRPAKRSRCGSATGLERPAQAFFIINEKVIRHAMGAPDLFCFEILQTVRNYFGRDVINVSFDYLNKLNYCLFVIQCDDTLKNMDLQQKMKFVCEIALSFIEEATLLGSVCAFSGFKLEEDRKLMSESLGMLKEVHKENKAIVAWLSRAQKILSDAGAYQTGRFSY